MRPIDIDIRQVGAVTVIRPSGRLDSGRVDVFSNALAAEIDQGRRRIVIDCEHTEFIASSGLRVLLVGRKRIDRHDGKLVICNMKPHVRSLFEVAGFIRIFDVVATADEAMARATPEGAAPPQESAARRRQRTTGGPGADAEPSDAEPPPAPHAGARRTRPTFDLSGAAAGPGRGGMLHALGKPWRVIKGLWTLLREA